MYLNLHKNVLTKNSKVTIFFLGFSLLSLHAVRSLSFKVRGERGRGERKGTKHERRTGATEKGNIYIENEK